MPEQSIVDGIHIPGLPNECVAVDLSTGIYSGMPHYPSPYLPEIAVAPTANHNSHKRAATTITFGSHSGTHADAPWHADPDGLALDRVPLSHWIGRAMVVRLAGRNQAAPIHKKDLEQCAIPEDVERLIIATGWCESQWGCDAYWTEGPYLAGDAADFLVKLPNLLLLGIDSPNIDAAADTRMGVTAPVHRRILSRGMVVLESLCNVSRLPDAFFLFAPPLRIVGGDGCPCRPIGIYRPSGNDA